MKSIWFLTGALIGATTLSIAMGSVPKPGSVTDDTALYQSLSEIQVPKQRPFNFDGDIARLSTLETRYREELPTAPNRNPRLLNPAKRIAKRKYHFTGNSSQQAGEVRN